MGHVGYLSLLFNEGRSCMWLFSVTIASIIIWSAVVKSLKKKHKGKIITLMSAGTPSGFILTVSLFQSIRFLKTSAKQISYPTGGFSQVDVTIQKKQRMQDITLLFLSLHTSVKEDMVECSYKCSDWCT